MILNNNNTYDSDSNSYYSDDSIESGNSTSESSNSTLESIDSNFSSINSFSKTNDDYLDDYGYDSKKRRQGRQNKQRRQDMRIINKSLTNNNIGWTSNLDKDTPFISYLIDKRINFCHLGASSHIAAFIPVSLKSWYCFIHHGRGKGRYR